MVKTLSIRLLEKCHSFSSNEEEVSDSSSSKKDDTKPQTSAGLVPAITPDGVSRVVLNKSGMRVSYSKKVKRITLQRWLVSKIVWHLDTVSFVELLTLYDNQLWCQEKCELDPVFYEKFGGFLEKLSIVLKKVQMTPANYQDTLRRYQREYKEAAEGHLIPERNLHTTERHVRGLFHVLPTRESGIPVKELPPVKVIGRGYRDKGTFRDPAWDGSLSWKELATYFAQMGEK